ARVRAHRRDPVGRVRRLLARGAQGPDRGQRVANRDHRGRGGARREEDSAEGERRRGDRGAQDDEGGCRRRRAAHRGEDRLEQRPRPWLPGRHARRFAGLRARADVRRGSALHPLYVGLDRKTERRAAHERRVSAVRVAHAQIRVRLPRRRHVLVRGRRRLGHGSQLHRLRPAIVDVNGQILDGAASGNLVLLASWPGQMRTVYGDHQRFVDTYFKQYPGKYFTGDGARRDADGYYWITGRVDDVINVAGHRLGTAEIESALVGHTAVAEAAVVGYPHDIKGQGIYCYVTLKVGVESSEAL